MFCHPDTNSILMAIKGCGKNYEIFLRLHPRPPSFSKPFHFKLLPLSHHSQEGPMSRFIIALCFAGRSRLIIDRNRSLQRTLPIKIFICTPVYGRIFVIYSLSTWRKLISKFKLLLTASCIQRIRYIA